MSDHLGLRAHAREASEGHGRHTHAALAEQEAVMAQIVIPGKCHFDADGWLRGPINITHVLTPNRYDSGYAERGRGICEHTEAGYEAGTVATFLNPASRVSAFFSIGRDGRATQYAPVNRGIVCWSQGAGNALFRGIEDEDQTHPSIPMTPEQCATFAQIMEACSEHDGFALQVTDDINGEGLIWHGAGGSAWGGHPDCPGDIRKAQRPLIVSIAKAIREGHMASHVVRHVTLGHQSLAALAAGHDPVATPAQILRLTAEHSPGAKFADNVAAFVNEVFEGRLDAQADVPAGLALYLPAKH